jgi:hypothetical protein
MEFTTDPTSRREKQMASLIQSNAAQGWSKKLASHAPKIHKQDVSSRPTVLWIS